MNRTKPLVLGTRTSDLALWQTDHIMSELQRHWPDVPCERKPFITKGDRTQATGKPLPAIGGKGLFTAELEESLRSGEIDMAVHSLKDLPVEDSPGLTIGAITSRADVRDALVAKQGWTVATLPIGAVVGTSSTRRTAQLLAYRPDLTVRSIRGNVATRIRKVLDGDYDATLLAVAGVARLGLMDHITEILPLDLMLPAPGQGALAVQCRAADGATLTLLAAIDDASVRAAVTAERTFLHALGGGCSAPVAAYAAFDGRQSGDHRPRTLLLQGQVMSTDGRIAIRVVKSSSADTDATTAEATTIGDAAAQEALAKGAAALIHGANASMPANFATNHRESVDKPLTNRRVVVTRAVAQADGIIEALQAFGASTIAIPTIRIEPLQDLTPLIGALRQLDQYAWLIFTSVNGVDIVAKALDGLAIAPERRRSTPVAAVGQRTADALRAHGFAPSFVPDRYVAEAIVAGLGNVVGKRILLPQAALARETLADRLTSAGATVDAIPIYATQPETISGDAVATLRQGVDLLTFTSGSTVRNFFATLHAQIGIVSPAEAMALLGHPTIACIGPVTADSVQELGLSADIVAAEHTVNGLVDAIVAFYDTLPIAA